MRKNRAFLCVMIPIVISAIGALALGAGPRESDDSRSVCASDQYLVTIYTMSTCVPLEFKNVIVEAHKKPGRSGGIFLNITGTSGKNRMCLRCHLKGTPSVIPY